jgi:hypothetical protein
VWKCCTCACVSVYIHTYYVLTNPPIHTCAFARVNVAPQPPPPQKNTARQEPGTKNTYCRCCRSKDWKATQRWMTSWPKSRVPMPPSKTRSWTWKKLLLGCRTSGGECTLRSRLLALLGLRVLPWSRGVLLVCTLGTSCCVSRLHSPCSPCLSPPAFLLTYCVSVCLAVAVSVSVSVYLRVCVSACLRVCVCRTVASSAEVVTRSGEHESAREALTRAINHMHSLNKVAEHLEVHAALAFKSTHKVIHLPVPARVACRGNVTSPLPPAPSVLLMHHPLLSSV